MALFFGTGAVDLPWDEENGCGDSYRRVALTVRVLSDIEFAKDNDCFISQVPTVRPVFWVLGMSYANCQVRWSKGPKATSGQLLLIYAQNASAPTKLAVLASVVDLADPELPESGGAHDTWFDCHVENCIFEEVGIPRDGIILRGKGWVGENVVDCFQLCVSRCLVLRYGRSVFWQRVTRRVDVRFAVRLSCCALSR